MIQKLNRTLLGSAIRAERIARGISQEELAEILGITSTHMKHIESGHRLPSVEVLYRIVVVLRLSLDALFLPRKSKDDELLERVIFQVRQCSDKQLAVIYAAANALLDNK